MTMIHYRPYFEDDHLDGRHTVVPYDVLDSVIDCPVLRGQPRNELGQTCIGCRLSMCERAELCSHIHHDGPVIISPDLEVFFLPGEGVV